MSGEIEKLDKFLKKKKVDKKIKELAKKYEGKKVLAYGAGQMADFIVNSYDISPLNVIGFSDSKYGNEKKEFNGYQTFSPAEIQDLNPDVIVLFVMEPKFVLEFFDFYYPELANIEKVSLAERTFWDKLLGN